MLNFGVILLLAGSALAVTTKHKVEKPEPVDWDEKVLEEANESDLKSRFHGNRQTCVNCKTGGESTNNYCEGCCSGLCTNIGWGSGNDDYICVEGCNPAYYQDNYIQNPYAPNCSPGASFSDFQCSGCCPGLCNYARNDVFGNAVYECTNYGERNCRPVGAGTTNADCLECCSKSCVWAGHDNNGNTVYRCENRNSYPYFQPY